jgi:uncharacterized protein (TIGR02444 family)
MAPSAPTSEIGQPLWRFSLSFYKRQGVAEACIELQDRAGVDVNLLLFLVWLAASKRRLAAADVKMLDDKLREWRNLTIVPLRAMRRALKSDPPLVPADTAEVFRTRIKAAELEAERLQQDALYAMSTSMKFAGAGDTMQALRDNISAYREIMTRDFPPEAVETLLGAFAPNPNA